MKYFWLCLECGYENHNKKVWLTKAGFYYDKQDPVKCPMCGKIKFKVVESETDSNILEARGIKQRIDLPEFK